MFQETTGKRVSCLSAAGGDHVGLRAEVVEVTSAVSQHLVEPEVLERGRWASEQ